jgi:hypothetical protein
MAPLFSSFFCPACEAKKKKGYAPHWIAYGYGQAAMLPEEDCEALTRFAEYAAKVGVGGGSAMTMDGIVVTFQISAVDRSGKTGG